MAINQIHHYTLLPSTSRGAAAVMQHVDLKSIDLSPLIREGLWLVPLPFPSSPGGLLLGVCLLAHTLYVLRSVGLPGGCAEWMGLFVQGACPGSFVWPALPQSLGQCKCLIALVMWLLWRVL